MEIIKVFREQLGVGGTGTFEHFGTKRDHLVIGVISNHYCELSLAFENTRELIFEKFFLSKDTNISPNKRAVYFKKPVNLNMIHGKVTNRSIPHVISIYLILDGKQE